MFNDTTRLLFNFKLLGVFLHFAYSVPVFNLLRFIFGKLIVFHQGVCREDNFVSDLNFLAPLFFLRRQVISIIFYMFSLVCSVNRWSQYAIICLNVPACYTCSLLYSSKDFLLVLFALCFALVQWMNLFDMFLVEIGEARKDFRRQFVMLASHFEVVQIWSCWVLNDPTLAKSKVVVSSTRAEYDLETVPYGSSTGG